DKIIAAKILELTGQLKGVHYLQVLKFPEYLYQEEEKANYIKQRFHSATALAAYMVRATLRSSHCALYEYLHGTHAANEKFSLKATKNPSGNIISKIEKCALAVPRKYIDDLWLTEEYKWLYDQDMYRQVCNTEIDIYKQINRLAEQLSGEREQK